MPETTRGSIKIVSAIPLTNNNVLVFFEDGKTKKFDVKQLFKEYPEFEALKNPELFSMLKVEPGGYGISWNEDLDCSEGELYNKGEDINISIEDFVSFAKHNFISTNEASNILKCSRQNIDDLIKRDKLHPIKTFPSVKIFLKSEVEHRTW